MTQSNQTEKTDTKNHQELQSMLERIRSLTSQVDEDAQPAGITPTDEVVQSSTPTGPLPPPSQTARPPAAHTEPEPSTEEVLPVGAFMPEEPQTLRQARLNESEVEGLILKYLLSCGEDTGHGIADQIKLPFPLVESLMSQMKFDQLIAYKGTTSVNDYVCQPTEEGRERARRLSQDCTYFGAAPVSLEAYSKSVTAQSLNHQHPTQRDLEFAFQDLLINPKMLARLGPAINSGKGMFLFGYPGNGKTSIAERVTKAFGQHIWIPRAIGVGGEIIRLYDPANHVEAPLDDTDGLMKNVKYDKRWVRIVRPTIIVGGELTMDNLELAVNKATGISEAPVQMKSNCGTLVIDDFGRQRMSTDELLNRWIVPLEKRYDFLSLASGNKIQVPFDQLVVFSTNLEPKDLVDEAFLRRIPYKIEVIDPSEEDFRKLFQIMCKSLSVKFNADALDYLVENHYRAVNRAFRCCHPRDLILQVRNFCMYMERECELIPETLDFAVENYFAVLA